MAQVSERLQGGLAGLKTPGRALAIRRRIEGIVAKLFVYIVLFDIAFVFLYPVAYMATTSLQTVADFIDPTVYWIPTQLYWENFKLAAEGLLYWRALANSSIIAVGSAALQVISCSLVGYGFARMRFPGREFLFMLAVFTFIVPPQTIIIPLFIVFKQLGWIDTYFPFLVPAAFANGLRGALFIFIFRQFFRGLPYELEDAARVDGAGPIRVYGQIMLPLAKPAILVGTLFSLVWHWNDFFEPMIFLMSTPKFTLPLRLSIFWTSLNEVTGGEANNLINEPLIMAASFLVIAPMLALYLFTQRFFTESIERTGLVG